MSNVINRPVLVINKRYTAVGISPVYDVISKVFSGSMLFIDENFDRHDWETWSILPVDGQDFLQTTRGSVKIPEVAIAINYMGVPMTEIQFSRRNIYLRDRVCQYTGDNIHPKDGSVDHVIPRSRGGANNWENVVWTSKKLNRIKGSKTPEEMGLKLIRKPFKPNWSPLLTRKLRHVPDFWRNFLRESDIKLLDNLKKAYV